jgi:hypothetical protein
LLGTFSSRDVEACLVTFCEWNIGHTIVSSLLADAESCVVSSDKWIQVFLISGELIAGQTTGQFCAKKTMF